MSKKYKEIEEIISEFSHENLDDLTPNQLITLNTIKKLASENPNNLKKCEIGCFIFYSLTIKQREFEKTYLKEFLASPQKNIKKEEIWDALLILMDYNIKIKNTDGAQISKLILKFMCIEEKQKQNIWKIHINSIVIDDLEN